MVEWQDEGILLAVRPHGETSAIVEAFTAGHGRHAGVVLGGVSRRMRPFLQPGVLARLDWRARLDEHLGHFVVEPLRNRAAVALGDRLALLAIGGDGGAAHGGAAGAGGAAAALRGDQRPSRPRGGAGGVGVSHTCNGRCCFWRSWASGSTSAPAR
jgi:hypothetical protein